MNGERFLTDYKVSERLKISRRVLQDYRNQGKIPYLYLGGKILYKDQILKWFWKKHITEWGNNFSAFMLRIYKKYCIFVMTFILTAGKPAIIWQAFFMPVLLYGGFVPPCRVLMHLLPSGESQRERRNRLFFCLKKSKTSM